MTLLFETYTLIGCAAWLTEEVMFENLRCVCIPKNESGKGFLYTHVHSSVIHNSQKVRCTLSDY